MKTRPLPPLLPAALALVAGIVVWAFGVKPVAIMVPGVAAALLWALKRRGVAIVAAWLAIGMLTAWLHEPPQMPEPLEDEPARYSAVVIDVNPDAVPLPTLTLEIDSAQGVRVRSFKARLAAASIPAGVEPFARVGFTAQLSPVKADASRLPDTFDYDAQLLKSGVTASGRLSEKALDELRVSAGETSLRSRVYSLGHELRRRIAWMPLSAETTSFFLATLAGDTSRLDATTRHIYSLTGCAHILALSGMHVGVIASLLFVMLMPLNLLSMSKWRWPLVLATLWLYALVTGAPVSVVRAVIMMTLIALAEILERRPQPLNSLSAAALVILVFSPGALFTVGFQLSFLAVAGILLMARPLNPFRPAVGNPPLWSEMLSVTLAATIATAPLAAWYFHVLPGMFLLTNVVMLTLLPFLMFGAVAVMAGAACGADMTGTGYLLDEAYTWLYGLLQRAASLPGVSADRVWISSFTLAAAYCAILLLALGLNSEKRRRALLTGSLVVGLLTVASAALPHSGPEGDKVFVVHEGGETIVMVHHADSLLIASSAPGRISQALPTAERRMTDYAIRHEINTFAILTDSMGSDAVKRRGALIEAGGLKLLLLSPVADSTILIPRGGCHYLIAGGSPLTGRLSAKTLGRVIASARPDTVVLTPSGAASSRVTTLLDSLRTPYVTTPHVITP